MQTICSPVERAFAVWLTSIATLCVASTFLASPAFAEEPYPPSDLISGITIDWSTHRRSAQGSDNFQLTWAGDNHLYGAWGDGGGFGGTNSKGRVGLGVARIEGDAKNFRGYNLWGGLKPEHDADFDGKSWGMIGIEKSLHMWVVPDNPVGKDYRNHYEYIELASSSDDGATWKKADWKFLQTDDLTVPTFLNFGRGNSGVPIEFGDYIYSYFIRPQDHQIEHQGKSGVGLIVHQPGALFLARVSPAELQVGRNSYEFFGGLDKNNLPRWVSLEKKAPVFVDPRGVGWCVSACFHPKLKRVLLCTEHDRSSKGYLGIFDSPTPWGPWSTVEYYSKESPFGGTREGSDLPWEQNVFFGSFPTKWFEGSNFTLTFTGAGRGRDNDSFNTVSGVFELR